MTKYYLALHCGLTLAAFAGTDPKAPLPKTTAPAAATTPLSFADGKVVFDLQERVRFESRSNNFDFSDSNDALTDDSWLLQRIRPGVKIRPTSWLEFYIQGQDTREIGADRPSTIGVMGAEGDDSFDLRQGYVRLGDPTGINVTVGRQVLAYGEERLVGPLDWLNQSRLFDAVKLRYETADWSIDAFSSSVIRFTDGEFNRSDWVDSAATRDQTFSGVYFSTTQLGPQTTDFYSFHLKEDGPADTSFLSVGTRVKADVKRTGGLDYEVELVGQSGKVQGKDLGSFAGHGGAGYVWVKNAWKPRFFTEYNYGSGDSNPNDSDVGTFQNLFPTNHKFYGFMDLFAWQNLHNPSMSFSFSPAKTVTVRADAHAFWVANTNDSWYRANGVTAVRPANASANSYAGSEIDLTVTYKPAAWSTIALGYSHFFAGNYLKATGAADDADFVYASFQFDF
jgi:Alginate export